MTVDQRGELPAGFEWMQLPEINASIPLPDKWHMMAILVDDEDKPSFVLDSLFQVSRESIPKRGFLTTGVTLYSATKFSQKLGGEPVSFVRRVLRARPSIEPLGEIEETEDENFVICRRRFVLPTERYVTLLSFHAEIVTQRMPPTHFYYLAAANKNTDTAYLGWFETPSSKWKDDRPIAMTMLNNLAFDPAF